MRLPLFLYFDLSTLCACPYFSVLFLCSKAYNHQRPDVIIMAVTSQMRSVNFFGDTAIGDWRAAGLLKPSVLKPIFTTVEKGLVLKRLGRLGSEDRAALAPCCKPFWENKTATVEKQVIRKNGGLKKRKYSSRRRLFRWK